MTFCLLPASDSSRLQINSQQQNRRPIIRPPSYCAASMNVSSACSTIAEHPVTPSKASSPTPVSYVPNCFGRVPLRPCAGKMVPINGQKRLTCGIVFYCFRIWVEPARQTAAPFRHRRNRLLEISVNSRLFDRVRSPAFNMFFWTNPYW